MRSHCFVSHSYANLCLGYLYGQSQRYGYCHDAYLELKLQKLDRQLSQQSALRILKVSDSVARLQANLHDKVLCTILYSTQVLIFNTSRRLTDCCDSVRCHHIASRLTIFDRTGIPGQACIATLSLSHCDLDSLVAFLLSEALLSR